MLDRLERGKLRDTPLDALRAARRERAARGTLLHPDRDSGHAAHPAAVHVVRDGGDEPARVRVPRSREDDVRRPLLHDPPRVQDGDPVRDLRDDREIVRDVDHGELALPAEPLDLLQDARLGDDVEAGRRLVQHDDGWLAGERERDRHPLLLSARELMREPTSELR